MERRRFLKEGLYAAGALVAAGVWAKAAERPPWRKVAQIDPAPTPTPSEHPPMPGEVAPPQPSPIPSQTPRLAGDVAPPQRPPMPQGGVAPSPPPPPATPAPPHPGGVQIAPQRR